MTRTRWTDERGSALPLLAIVLGGVVLVLSTIALQTSHRIREARAEWAADGSARAAAAEVRSGLDGGGAPARAVAVRVAEANGARLISIELVDDLSGQVSGTSRAGIDSTTPISPIVVVEVDFGGVRASSAAARFAVAGR